MSTSNALGDAKPTTASRKRSAVGRVVPAIPLPLSKPRRQTQPQIFESDDKLDIPDRKVNGESNDGEAIQEKASDQIPTTTTVTVNGDHHRLMSEGSRPDIKDSDDAGSAPMSVSSSNAPDAIREAGSVEKITPPVQLGAQAPSPAATSTPSRHSMERFDLRHIRTELPPAFVPSAGQHTPLSTSSSQTRRNPQFPNHVHASRPSASSIVFGSTNDSSRSSPAPPQPSNSGFMPPLSQAPNGNFQPPPNFVTGFDERLPDPHIPSTQHQHAMWNMTRPLDTHPQQMIHAQQQPRYPSREPFSPTEQPFANGHRPHSRPASRASSAAFEGHRTAGDGSSLNPVELYSESARLAMTEAKATMSGLYGQRHSFPSRHMPPPPPPMGPQEMHFDMDNALTMRDHVRGAFGEVEFSDCHLQITDADGNRRYLDAHKLILARSPELAARIRDSPPPQSASLKTQVSLHLTARYVQIDAFCESLRYLYGAPILAPEKLQAASSNQDRMEMALQSIATGVWLKFPPISARAMDVAGGLLHWDTVSLALAFALEGGLNQTWMVDEGAGDISAASSESSYSRPEAAGIPTYDPFASQLLHRIIDFLVHCFPNDFFLDTTAAQLEASQRLPPAPSGHEHRPSRSDPRLSAIRFGEMAATEPQRPSPVTTVISSLLLSLPFPILKVILEHPILTQRLGADTVGSIMRAVVAERERRRGRAAVFAERVDEGTGASVASQNLHWIETVEPSNHHRAGFKLVRRRKGIDTPLSSGTEAESAAR